MKTSFRLVCLGVFLFAFTTAAATRMRTARLGKQPDESYMVSTGQRIGGGAIAFASQPHAVRLGGARGLDPKYLTPRAMMADNDATLGRIVGGAFFSLRAGSKRRIAAARRLRVRLVVHS